MNKNKLFSILAVLALLTGTLVSGPSRSFAADSRTFPETGKTVNGRFLTYWDNNGGLPQQGYPISEEMQEQSDTDGKTYTMQYFERAVFEYHPENAGTTSEVLLSLLGVFFYNAKHGGDAPGQQPSTTNPRKFSETGKTIGGAFRKYWEQHGGLAQQGYPISDEFQEVNDTDGKTYKVQYFQRAVFEYHPEFAGTANEVLLSLLGVFFYNSKHGGGGSQPPAFSVASPGWTIIAVATNNIALFYNATNGTGATARVGADGTLTPLQRFPDPAATDNDSFGAGWTHIVPGPNNLLFFYSQSNGLSHTFSMHDDGVVDQLVTRQLTPGWSHISIDVETGLALFYQKTDTKAYLSIGKLSGDGAYSDVKAHENNVTPASFPWSQFVPVGSGIWFWYVQGNGNGITLKINPDGTFTDLKSYTNFDRDWTHITYAGTSAAVGKLYLYKKDKGVATTSFVVHGPGNFIQKQTYTGLSTSWSNFASAPNGVVVIYATGTGKIATDRIDGDGNAIGLQRYEPGQ